MRIKEGRYILTKKTVRPGTVTAQSDKIVDHEYVKRYVDAAGFFTSLGGTETITRNRRGEILCVSVSPDETETSTVLFTPIKPAKI